MIFSDLAVDHVDNRHAPFVVPERGPDFKIPLTSGPVVRHHEQLGIDRYEAALRAELGLGPSDPIISPPPAGSGVASIYGLGDATVEQVIKGAPQAHRLTVVERRTLAADGEGSDARNGHAIVTAPLRRQLVAFMDHVARVFDADLVR